jgi:two-component system CheB/CheR fusion protein
MTKKSSTSLAKKKADKKLVQKADNVVPILENDAFPIVGIGASAGGLEAIEQFLSKVPADIGMGFVVVQHLDPVHKDMMCEILQRVTPLKVEQIKESMKIKPNHVYVIPPAHDLAILNGELHLLDPSERHGLRLPIDYFFRSLAADQKEHSLAVILSGMGSDGTLGLRAIKEQAGATFVQSPDSAKFDAMPRSAINAGLADFVASAEDIVEKIVTYTKHAPLLSALSTDAVSVSDDNGFEKVAVLLRSQTGHDFSLYKKSTIFRRIERRMGLHQLTSLNDYIRYLRTNPQELDLLFSELLIGVTNFFRDPEMWAQLKTETIPELLANHPEGGTLRAWVPACSTGEEAYSLAMTFHEALVQVKPEKHFSLQIFATDLDREAIEHARAAEYPHSISADVSEERLTRFFVKTDSGYRITQEVREMVVFAPQNLVMDPPFTKLDILSCRNLLIYLEADLQKKLIPLFHYSLNPSGVLILGTAETIGNADTLFVPYSGKQRIYKRREAKLLDSVAAFPLSEPSPLMPYAAPEKDTPVPTRDVSHDLQVITNSLLLKCFSPAALLTTEKGDIVYIHGKTGKYLEPAAGKVSHNLFAMARDALVGPLGEAFSRAVRQSETIELKGISIGAADSSERVDLSVQPLLEPEAIKGMVLVVFRESAIKPAPIKVQGKGKQSKEHIEGLDALSLEVKRSREELQTTRDEMQLSQEELKTTNEELQSTNEELQSTNEELTTSKEEMQSMNEELQTVNQELSAKVNELSLASDDMKNLLNSTDIATLFLDNTLKVRRFTSQTAGIIKLISTDVGRPITDLVSSLDYVSLADDAREVLRTLIFHEVEVSTNDGGWYLVRIMPYRTQDNRIDGVVITFSDTTVSKHASLKLAESESRFRLLFENSLNAVAYQKVILEKDKAIDLTYIKVNHSFTELTGFKDVSGKNISDFMPSLLLLSPDYLAACGRVATSGKTQRIEHHDKRSRQWFLSTIYSQEKGFVVSVTENITVKKRSEQALKEIQNLLAGGAKGSEVKKMTETEMKHALYRTLKMLDEHFDEQ